LENSKDVHGVIGEDPYGRISNYCHPETTLEKTKRFKGQNTRGKNEEDEKRNKLVETDTCEPKTVETSQRGGKRGGGGGKKTLRKRLGEGGRQRKRARGRLQNPEGQLGILRHRGVNPDRRKSSTPPQNTHKKTTTNHTLDAPTAEVYNGQRKSELLEGDRCSYAVPSREDILRAASRLTRKQIRKRDGGRY